MRSVALPRAGGCRYSLDQCHYFVCIQRHHFQCQRREMAVYTNNGLVNGPVHNLLLQFFTLGSSKIEVFETYFYDIVIT